MAPAAGGMGEQDGADDAAGRRRLWRGVAAGMGVCVAVALVVCAAFQEPPQHGAALATRARRNGGAAGGAAGPARTAELSEADLYRRSGAAEDIVAAQNAQKAAAVIFVQAVEDETRLTRELATRAQWAPDTMASAREARADMAANEAEIKRLGNKVLAEGQVQVQASASYVAEGQKRYAAVDALQNELRQEAQAAYDIKAAVVGTDAGRFDPTSEGAAAFDPTVEKQDSYHVARLMGVDSDGTQSLCGRAEVRHDDKWGTICSRGFTQASAEMFCKTMGLTGGAARYHDAEGNPTWDDTGCLACAVRVRARAPLAALACLRAAREGSVV